MYYGLDVGGTKIEFGAFDKTLTRMATQRVATPTSDYQALVDAIVGLVEEYDAQFETKGLVGIGLPGVENVVDGSLLTSNVPAAKGKLLRADLEARLGRPVKISNDANCFALSEAWDEEHQGKEVVLGLILGTGFGGGIVVNGHVVSGSSNVAGELGHTRLPLDAWMLLVDFFGGADKAPIFECGCDNKGCIDNYLSGRGFEWLYAAKHGEKVKAVKIIEQFALGEAQAVEFVEMFVELLARCIANIQTMFDANVILLGGGLSNFEHLYKVLPDAIRPHLMAAAQVPQILKAKHGDSGGVRGAAFLNLD